MHDHSNILHNEHYSCLTSTTSLAAVWNSSWPFSIQGSTRSRTALYLSNDCWWLKSVDVCDQLMHGHYVSYCGPGPSLMTGALLWLDRRSGLGLYRLHCMTLTAFTASKSSWKRILFRPSGGCRAYTVVNSLFLRITNTVTYLLTVIVTSLTNCYHETSVNKTVKLTFLRQLY